MIVDLYNTIFISNESWLYLQSISKGHEGEKASEIIRSMVPEVIEDVVKSYEYPHEFCPNPINLKEDVWTKLKKISDHLHQDINTVTSKIIKYSLGSIHKLNIDKLMLMNTTGYVPPVYVPPLYVPPARVAPSYVPPLQLPVILEPNLLKRNYDQRLELSLYPILCPTFPSIKAENVIIPTDIKHIIDVSAKPSSLDKMPFDITDINEKGVIFVEFKDLSKYDKDHKWFNKRSGKYTGDILGGYNCHI